MWNGSKNAPPCITIFSAPNYCDHDNPGTVFVTGPGVKSKILTYGEAPYKPYYLPNQKLPDEQMEDYTIEYPLEPIDALRWFMFPMRESITQFFNVVVAKINSHDEDLSSLASPEIEGTFTTAVEPARETALEAQLKILEAEMGFNSP